VPGPGKESAFQQYCGAEYERVLGLALTVIHANTEIEDELAETLARKVAAAQADALYRRLSE